jgi:ABC-2 type transport system ATP-binding protein
MNNNDTAIAVNGLKKSFKNTPVLRGVDFEVERGSVFALLGSNGAGKTTTIKILTTLLQSDEGKIVANGTIEELRKILPEGEVEMVRKQPTLEDVFLAIVNNKEAAK